MKTEIGSTTATSLTANTSNRIDALKKGIPIVVSGSLKQESWEKDGKKNSKMVIMVDDIVFCDQSKKESPAPDKSPETKQGEDVPF